MQTIAIIGGGPTALYTLAALTGGAATGPRAITLYERESRVGPGMPYRDGMNDAAMLCNISSREVPPLTRTLADYLSDCDPAQRADLGVTGPVTDEDFYPRLALGAYFTAELAQIVARARGRGHSVELRTRVSVTDIRPDAQGIGLDWRDTTGTGTDRADHVVIATGHDWSHDAHPALTSPWPARTLRRLGGEVGILGSSLSAIDVVVTLAHAHGAFRRAGKGLRYDLHDAADPLRMTLLSRRGLLPEADWYYPLPLPSLPGFDPAAAEDDIARGRDDLLERSFARFVAALAQADPKYAARVDLSSPEAYYDSHFAPRMAQDPWDHAREDLAQAARDRRAHRAVPWRVALLIAHEVFELLTPRFSDAELDRFSRTLGRVFTDTYASVPHRSIRRLLALRDAGRLELRRLPGETQIDGRRDAPVLTSGDETLRFDHLVDARGQRAAKLTDLGFAGLDASVDPRWRQDSFLLPLTVPCPGTVHCLSLPVLLRRRPFIQGLVNTQEMAEAAAEDIARADRPVEATAA